MPITTKVIDIATKPIVAIEDKKSAVDASVLMFERDISSLVVTSRGEAVGILTERDLLRKVLMQGLDPSNVVVGQVMSKSLITIDGEASLADATALMLEKKIRHLLVRERGKITAMCTSNDIEKQVYEIFSALARL